MTIKKYLEYNIDYDYFLLKAIQILLIIIGSMIIYYLIRLIVRRIFSISLKSIRIKDHTFINKRRKTLEKIILSLWRYFVYVVTFLIILSSLGVNIQTILTGAGILGVVFAVGSQHLLQDFLEGFFNVFEDNISVGDYVTIDNVEGNIVDIGLRTIKIKSFTGEIHIIPNAKIGHIINYSLDEGKALIDVLIDYHSDLSKTLEVIRNTLFDIKQKNSNILTDPVILGVNKLEKMGYEIRIICITVRETHWSVQRFMRQELMNAFIKNEILIGMNQIIIKNEHFLK